MSILPGMLLIGLGVGMTMPLATEGITVSLPAKRQGVASALNDITRELGSAIGVAILGADTIISAARHAFMHGWSTSMWIGAAAMFLLLLFLAARAPRPAISPAHTHNQEDAS